MKASRENEEGENSDGALTRERKKIQIWREEK